MSQLVYITVPDSEAARAIASALVRKKLAAGANICGPVNSIFRWQGSVCERAEWIIFLQADESSFQELEKIVLGMHPDQIPCIITLPITRGHSPFMHWITANSGTSQCT